MMKRNPERGFDMLARQLPHADRVILANPAFRAALIDETRNNSATAGLAAAQDFELFAAPWGFCSATSARACTSGKVGSTVTCPRLTPS